MTAGIATRQIPLARTGISRFKDAVLWTAGGSLSVQLDNINALIMALSLKYIFVFLECNNGNSLVNVYNVIKKTADNIQA